MGEFNPQELEMPLIHKSEIQIEQTTITQTTDTARQSNTPVVSLLSIDHQQEKDFTSMQSGRRRKSPSHTPRASTPHNHNFLPNGFQTGYHHHHPPTHHHHSYPPNMYVGHMPHCLPPHIDYGAATQKHLNSNNNNNNNRSLMNGHERNYNRKKRSYDRPQQSYHADNASSVRSDSNSSASVVDENRNENKIVPTENHTIHTSVAMTTLPYTGSNSRVYSNNHYQNHNNNNNNNTVRSWGPYRGGANQDRRGINNKTYVPKKVYNSNNNTSHKEPNNAETVYNKNNIINLKNNVPVSENVNGVDLSKTTPISQNPTNVTVPQIHPASSQHFAPPSRRNRKTVRRNTTAISEIGAGDAPLPVQQDVTDIGKKLESLKL